MAFTFSGPVPVPEAQTAALNVLVTGAARGLGFELVNQYANAHQDNTVFAAVRKTNDALTALASKHKNIHIITLDASDESSIRNSVKQVLKVTNHIDILFNNAGIYGEDDAADPLKATTKQLTDVFVTNVAGPLIIVQAYHTLLLASKQSPRVISVSSNLGSNVYVLALGKPTISYGISKAALTYLNTAWRYAVPEVTFLAIHPGWVETDMGTDAGKGQKPPTSINDSVSAIRYYTGKATIKDSGNFLDTMTGNILPF